jgi:hypothetical protein
VVLQVASGFVPPIVHPHEMLVPWQVFITEPHSHPAGRSAHVFGTQQTLPVPQTSPGPVHGHATLPPHALVAFAQLPGVQVGVGQLQVPAVPGVELEHVAGLVHGHCSVLPPQLSARFVPQLEPQVAFTLHELPTQHRLAAVHVFPHVVVPVAVGSHVACSVLGVHVLLGQLGFAQHAPSMMVPPEFFGGMLEPEHMHVVFGKPQPRAKLAMYVFAGQAFGVQHTPPLHTPAPQLLAVQLTLLPEHADVTEPVHWPAAQTGFAQHAFPGPASGSSLP